MPAETTSQTTKRNRIFKTAPPKDTRSLANMMIGDSSFEVNGPKVTADGDKSNVRKLGTLIAVHNTKILTYEFMDSSGKVRFVRCVPSGKRIRRYLIARRVLTGQILWDRVDIICEEFWEKTLINQDSPAYHQILAS